MDFFRDATVTSQNYLAPDYDVTMTSAEQVFQIIEYAAVIFLPLRFVRIRTQECVLRDFLKGKGFHFFSEYLPYIMEQRNFFTPSHMGDHSIDHKAIDSTTFQPLQECDRLTLRLIIQVKARSHPVCVHTAFPTASWSPAIYS